MIQVNEATGLVLMVGAFLFVLANRSRLRHFPRIRLHVLAFFMLLMAQVFTVVEGVLWADAFNMAEHICYLVGMVMLAAWVWMALDKETPLP
jgi:hypothetical protein